VPANIQFHVADAKKPFSSEFHEKFDVVHLRLLIASMNGDDWKTVTHNVCMLLKPGGAIQWTEGNFMQLYPALRGSQDLRSTASRLSTYVRTWLDLPGFAWWERLAPSSSGWSSLPRIFRDLGFQDAEDNVVSSDRLGEEGRRIGTEVEMGAYASSFQIAGMSEGEIEAIRKPAEADAANGAYVRWICMSSGDSRFTRCPIPKSSSSSWLRAKESFLVWRRLTGWECAGGKSIPGPKF
jgi:hypothetical protein